MDNRKVAVVGGGIGGIAAALSLAQRGLRVTVYEQASRLDEVGAGIQLSPNAMRVLHHLGLDEAIRMVSCRPDVVEIRRWHDGRSLARTAVGSGRFDFPYCHIHRADLIEVMARHADAHANISIVTSARVDDVIEYQDRVTLLIDGHEHHADVVVGADGLHSRVRGRLFGAEAPRFTGQVAWRALVPAAAVPADLITAAATAWWGPHRHFIHYYVRGEQWINCVGVIEQTHWTLESWTERGEYGTLKAEFAEWHPSIRTLIDGIDPESCFKWALFDRPPMQSWCRGKVTLLGDACHATLPFLAQGAAMAIEDGAVLAACLSGSTDTHSALRRYQSLRLPRTSYVQMASRRNARIFHLSGPMAWLRDRVAGTAAGLITDRIYRHNVYAPFEESHGHAG